MRKRQRQRINRIAEATAVGLVALDLLLFFAIYRPLGGRIAETVRKHEDLRQRLWNQQRRVGELAEFEAALPATGKELEDFTARRTPSRREAYSSAAHLVHRIADASNVAISGAAYHLDAAQNDPLERLAIEVNVEGSYANLLKFSHALETANEFVSVRDFDLAPEGENGALRMRLGADLYLTP